MLYYNVFLLFMFSTQIVSLKISSINLFIQYFKYRNVGFACVLNCEDNKLIWSRTFTKAASKNSIAVSNVNINHLNYAQLRNNLDHQFSSNAVILDTACQKTKEVLYFASENTLFASKHKWIIVEENCNFNDTISNGHVKQKSIYSRISDLFENLYISVDADIIFALRKDRCAYDIYDVYNFGKMQGGGLVISNAGSWKLQTGLDFKLNNYKYYNRWDFKKWSMRMIAVVSPPPIHFDPKILTDRQPAAGVAYITKTSATVIHVIAEIHNFRFVYTMADRWIGTFESNNSKIVATSLYYKEQDVSPLIRWLPSVYEKISILHPPVAYLETKYYYRIPTRGPGKFENQFLRPLSTSAWACVVSVISLCAIVLLLSARLEQRPSSTQYAVFSVFASMCQQFFQDTDGIGMMRDSTARKLTILVTGISCVLIYNFYTSSVVSWLLNGPPPSINSLQELLESPLELIYEDIGYTKSWLQTPKFYYNKRNSKIEDEIRQKKVFNKKKDAPLLKSLEEGIRMVKAGGYAYHTEVNSANDIISRTFTQSELCELGSLQSIEKTHLYSCVQKNSPYKEFLTWSLMRLSERGIVSCIQRRTSSPAVTCEGSSPRALALGGAAPAFLLLAVGCLLAIAIMLVERCVYELKSNGSSN